MNRTLMTTLAVAAVAAAGLALWTSGERRAASDTEDRGPLVEALEGALNQVTAVSIRGPGQQVTLNRGEDAWTVAERGGYPADVADLRKQLLALAEARVLERKTANPDNYALLGVQDVDEEGAEGVAVGLEGLAEPLSLIVGKSNYQGGASTYVRREGEDQSWLVTGSLDFPADPADWLVKDVINVASARVREVLLTHPDGETVHIAKAGRDDPNFVLLNLPEGREPASANAGSPIASALGSLRLDDVMPVEQVGETPAAVEGLYRTFDGLEVVTRAWKEGEDHYLTLAVRFDPELVVPEEPEATVDEAGEGPVAADAGEAADAPAEAAVADENALAGGESQDVVTAQAAEIDGASEPEPEPEPEEDSGADVAGEAVTLQAEVDGWVFKIPSYKYTNLSKRVDDLLKPLPEADDGE